MKYHDNSLKANEEKWSGVHHHEILEFGGGLKNILSH